MRLVSILLLIYFSTPVFGSGCDDMTDPKAMYDRFFQIAYEVKTINGKPTNVTRTPSKAEAIEGWKCIEKATKKGNCSAIRIQELYYRHGVGEAEFGIPINIEKADHYLLLRKKHCGY